jgi:hypothetical protein
MDFDIGNPPFEAGEALLDLLLEAGVAVVVAGNLVVGVDLDKQGALSMNWLSRQCDGSAGVPRFIAAGLHNRRRSPYVLRDEERGRGSKVYKGDTMIRRGRVLRHLCTASAGLRQPLRLR